MTGTTHHTADVACPDCGNSDAIVRVRGNAISSVCTVCRRADVGPLLDVDDLAAVSPELDGDLFELEAARCGAAQGVTRMLVSQQVIDDSPPFGRLIDAALQVELRLPVPPR